MANQYVGEIRCFAFGYAPRNWAQCNGQLMAINQNQALFAIIGTTYGGNGVTTFGLPNMQGQIPMHWGNGPGGNTAVGEVQGTTAATINLSQMAPHNHQISAVTIAAGAGNERSGIPTSTSFLGPSTVPNEAYQGGTPTANSPFSPKAISMSSGSSAPHDNMQPYLVLNFCVALYGTFPSRN